MYKNNLFQKISNYWQTPARGAKHLVLWFCIFISMIPAGYSFYLFSFYNVLLLLLQVLMVFFIVFLLIECYDHPNRAWNFQYWWKKPLSIKALRCLVAVPIYNGIYGVCIWLFAFCSFQCDL